MSIEIKQVEEEHINETIRLMKGYFEFYRTEPPSEKRLRGLITSLINDPSNGTQFIAFDDGNAVGFATLYIIMSTFSTGKVTLMNDLYVDPEYRQKGYGKLLFDKCKQFTKDNGYPKMEWMTEPDNTRAIKFYDDRGGVSSKWLYYNLRVSN